MMTERDTHIMVMIRLVLFFQNSHLDHRTDRSKILSNVDYTCRYRSSESLCCDPYHGVQYTTTDGRRWIYFVPSTNIWTCAKANTNYACDRMNSYGVRGLVGCVRCVCKIFVFFLINDNRRVLQRWSMERACLRVCVCSSALGCVVCTRVQCKEKCISKQAESSLLVINILFVG